MALNIKGIGVIEENANVYEHDIFSLFWFLPLYGISSITCIVKIEILLSSCPSLLKGNFLLSMLCCHYNLNLQDVIYSV